MRVPKTSPSGNNDQASVSAYPQRSPHFVVQPPLAEDGEPIIRRVIIANRGEIACRIIETCRKLHVASIAIYVTEDALSTHVSQADESICLGSVDGPGGNPYLDAKLLVQTALSVRACAVHPGYGFLSENPGFADAVRDAGLIFIGPSSIAMSTLGDKRAAKAYLAKHAPHVPLIPGFTGSSQSFDDLKTAAEEIGYPIMVKASSGGGGKGMRIVYESSRLGDELERAQSEAQRSFGSSDCILEKYIERGKHIEIQVVGDQYGKVISLWERECSVQRRHQKVIEETPSIYLDAKKRREMGMVAVSIGELLKYEGAGTVEFVVDISTGKFYFLEVNTRLQVEHPITEEVTGIDIVALQLFVAASGRILDVPALSHIPQTGHAIECRLCAEDPRNDFFPQHGLVRWWQPAQESRDTRYETAIQTGSSVSIHFDSMIAKVVVWAPTRALAIEKAVKVLGQTVCVGVKTNQEFLQRCLLQPEFRNPEYSTSFIPTNIQGLLINDLEPDLTSILALVPCVFLRHQSAQRIRPFQSVRLGFRNQQHDPVNVHSTVVTSMDTARSEEPLLCLWRQPEGSGMETYRVNISCISTYWKPLEKAKSSVNSGMSAKYNAISNAMRNGDVSGASEYHVAVHSLASVKTGANSKKWQNAKFVVSINNRSITAYLCTEDLSVGAKTMRDGGSQQVFCHFPALGTWIGYRCFDLLSFCEDMRQVGGPEGSQTRLKSVKAPMPCKVLSVLKKNGEVVKAGENVMVIESMKMETNISIPADGTFQTQVKMGNAVAEGTVLCSVV